MPGSRKYVICAALVVLTLAVYWQVHGFGLIVLDDDDYVANNEVVKAGLTWTGVKWAFTTGKVANWHPVTWLSHMLDCQVFGVAPGRHHLVNVLFHMANTLLLFLVLERATRGMWQSAFVAALFALHPLHVESVAWVSERKDVLSTFFWLLTMAGYVAYVKRRSVARYLLVAVPFAIGLMAKPMLVTLPCVLLLMDYWPLGRLNPAAPLPEKRKKKRTEPKRPPVWPIVLEKLPLFALAAVSSAITYVVQQRGGAMRSLESIPLIVRFGNAAVAYLRYIGKTLWPLNLSVYYPHMKDGVPSWLVLAAVVLLGAACMAVFRWRRQHPYLLMGWLWFLGTLVPVIGLVQVGSQAMADRYTYVPAIGLFIMAAWGAAALPAWPYRGGVLALAAGATVAALTVLAGIQTAYWSGSVGLFEHALLAAPDHNDFAHFNLGIALKREGRPGEALRHFDEAIRIRPSYTNAHIYLGLIEYEQRNYDEAVLHFNTALEYAAGHPSHADVLNDLGAVYYAQGRIEDAAGQYRKAVQLKPAYADGHFNLGHALERLGQHAGAMDAYKETLRLDPKHARARGALAELEAQAPPKPVLPAPGAPVTLEPQTAVEHYVLGNSLASEGKYADAAIQYGHALRLNPSGVDARINLGNALAAQGKLREAAAQFGKVIEVQPSNVDAHLNLGNVFGELGDLRKAEAAYRNALRFGPLNVDACFSLGYTIVKQGKLDEAAQLFSKALLIDPKCERAREALENIEEYRKRK